MSDSKQIKEFITKLNNSFVLTGSEVIHIRQVNYLLTSNFFHYDNYHYTEIRIAIEGTSYHLENDNIVKQDIEIVELTINCSEVIRATRNNIALLLLDNCRLVRDAAKDLYRKVS